VDNQEPVGAGWSVNRIQDEAAARPPGGLAALREQAYSGMLPQKAMDVMLGQQVVDPSAKWNAYAGAALRPATGGFGESMGNALGALSEGQGKEAELRSKYLPLLAQAMMQRQLQAAQLAMQQYKLNQDFDKANVGALTGLLHKREPITSTDVAQALGGVVQRGLSPPEYSNQYFRQLPLDDKDPDAIRNAIKRLAISGLEGKEALGQVTPSGKPQDFGGFVAPWNENANAPQGLGMMPPSAGKTFSPSDLAGATNVEADQAGNKWVGSKLTNDYRLMGRGAPNIVPGQPPKLGVAGGAAGPGGAPGASAGVPPVGAAPASPTAPPVVPPGGPGPIGSGGPPVKTVAGLEYEKDTGKSIGQYQEDMGKSLEAMRSLQQRLGEMKGLVKNFQPGASGEMRLQLGTWAKDLATTLGVSPAQADSIAQSLAKGDVSSAQAFQKLAIQGTLDILKAATPRFTQAEFATVSNKANPNLLLDPMAFDKMANFFTQQYNFKSAEQQAFTKYQQAGQPVEAWPSVWNSESKRLGYIKPTFITGAGKGSNAKPSETATDVDTDGRPIYFDSKTSKWRYSK